MDQQNDKPRMTTTIEEQLQLALTEYSILQRKLKPLLAEQKELRATIKALTLNGWQAITFAGVEVTIRAGSQRITWDTAGLTRYGQTHPEIFNFRRIKNVDPTISIKTLKETS